MAIIHYLFFTLIAVQICLLLFKRKVFKQISSKKLNTALIVKVLLGLGYIVFAGRTVEALSSMPVLVVCVFGFVATFILFGLVWNAYLPNTIEAGKTYQMSVEYAKKDVFMYRIYGSIDQDGLKFPVVAYASESLYHKLDDLGYFNEKSKTINVSLSDREVEKEDKPAYAAMYFS